MRTMTCAEFLTDCVGTVDAVGRGGEAVAVTQEGHESVVLLSMAEYTSLKETVHLLRDPANARRLLASIGRLEHGAGTVRDGAGRRAADE
ncbi:MULTISPECIES: type II toxin-antitoxin system prevent-host-death family antitoxin [unclassified Streptomyces]|uniref:type II toxin-antitoxin system Phd/YefM family antitoxin n=1 Tax=unclassified Streptomyces TaxID=2593676 RepID=UPI000823ACBB|nr:MULTISPECIES: type II toxin-antitoxin system prevent-host-death family antitoxin [unclassified Streptomyces]MYT98137.1 type II toxin-antitoxin system prevent-host-death family antitoxin [Streptomyces sp. SID8350]SCK35249.1 antitoxin YefM [Streptomyces sp. AmelKG-D3]